MYTLINGSPKVSSSNSSYFLNTISQNLDNYKFFELKKDKYNNIINSINESDTIVLAFPLYVDSPPAIVLSFLDYIIDNKIKMDNKLIYIISNCGFIEGKQNITAINIIKRWCKKVNAIYMSAILIGAGEIVGNKKYKLLSKTTKRNLQKFTNAVQKKQKSPDIITTTDLLNSRMFCYVANISWNKNAKKNNLTEKDVRTKK